MTPFTPNRFSGLAWLLSGSLGVNVLILVIVVAQGFAIRNVGAKDTQTLVQMHDGSAYKVQPVAAESRTPKVIKVFTTNTLTQLFNWNGTIVDVEGNKIRDPGIEIETSEGRAKVPTASVTASFALAEDFRLPFLEKIAELTPSGVFNHSTQVVLIIDNVSEPQEVATGKWRLKVISHLAVFKRGLSPEQTIPFYREITVQATSTPVVPTGETPLEQAVYTVRQAGLIITDIRPIEN
ncbi:hypothetical protein PN498_13230 [Oscillatoria sp. CS-180]|uniref:hypothetical protein n=1 Tax=Oscillatoria sp. CS-180 TaxID=3021720 RepID=UPI00232AB567|nr:hypothetical protein [Oscillatoria sp. CS-180]MDB9526956.1 hypothetical protein [Oscillatoria sp. CS-180]